MTRHETTGTDSIGVPVGARKWTPDQVSAWIQTGATPPRQKRGVPRPLRIAVWHRDDGICAICGEPADPLDWTADHIVPEALDGPTVIHNLRVTHPRCNRQRPVPYKMTDEEIADACAEWTSNQMVAALPDFDAFYAAHRDAPAFVAGEWTCRCPMCETWREAMA